MTAPLYRRSAMRKSGIGLLLLIVLTTLSVGGCDRIIHEAHAPIGTALSR